MPLTVPKGLMRWFAPCPVDGGGLSTSLLNIIPEGIHLPLHLLCAKEVPGRPQEEAEPSSRGEKNQPREGRRQAQGHTASLAPRCGCQASARLLPPPPSLAACVARLVLTGYPALTWCQSLPGPVPGLGFNGTGMQRPGRGVGGTNGSG